MPEAKQTEQKMQSFDDVVFTMTSFSANTLEKKYSKKDLHLFLKSGY